jgi:hypothetical protein
MTGRVAHGRPFIFLFSGIAATLHSHPRPSPIFSRPWSAPPPSGPFPTMTGPTCLRPASMGYIPLENVIGRVGMIFFSRDACGDGTPTVIRYERIGTVVQ